MHTAQKVRKRLRNRWLMAAALLCALLAAVTVAVELPEQPAGATSSDQSGSSSSGSPAAPTTSTAETTPKAPSGLSATLSGGWVRLSWDLPSPPDATITKYQYRIRAVDTESDYGVWTDIPSSGPSAVGFNFPVIGSGRRNVQLRAVNTTGSGGHAVVSTGVPAAPSRLRASLSGGSVSLSWDDPDDDSIQGYQYRIKTVGVRNSYGSWTDIADSGDSTASATITVTGTERRNVQLRARNSGGSGSSAIASTGRPAHPSGYSIPGGTDYGNFVLRGPSSSPKGEVDLHWSDPGDDSIVKYRYQLRPARPGTVYSRWIDIPGSGASTTSHKFVMPTSAEYRIRVGAVNNAGAAVRVINVRPSWPTPAAPSGLKASLSGGTVALSWNNPFDDSIWSYQYRIKTVGAGNVYGSWTTITNTGVSNTSATITVTGSERRNVQLRARNSQGAGNPATASTGRPARPSGFRIPGGSSGGTGWPWANAPDSSPKGEVDMHWSDPGDDSIVKYQYQLRPARAGTVFSRWIDIPGSGASTTSHKFALPTPESYRLRLRAVNSAGATTGSINTSPSWPAPAAPSGLKATLNGSTVSLSWDNPFDDSIGKYQYRIKTAGTGNAYSSWTDITGSDDSTTSAVITVTGSERRVVQLRADESDPATASTGPPAQPSGFTTPATKGTYRSTNSGYVEVKAAASLPKGEVVVNWSDPGDDSIIKYQYNYRPTGTSGANNSQWIDIPSSGASTTSHTFTMPTPKEYRVRVRAVNKVGAAAQVVHVQPSWPAPATPTGLKATLSGSTVSLSWHNPFDGSIEKYQYRIKTAGAGNSYGSWTDIADSAITGSNGPTLSTTITVTGSERRVVQLRAVLPHGIAESDPATASTGPPAQPSGFTTPATKGTYRSTNSGYVEVKAAASLPKGEVVVNWSDPGDDSIIKYQYNYRPTGTPGVNNSPWIDIPNSGPSTTSHTFAMPTPEEYRVRVRAVNEAGAAAQVVHVQPSWPAPAAPTGLKATLSGNTVSLNWDNPFNGLIEKYQYRIKTAGTENAYSSWTDIADSAIAGSNGPTLSTTITVTGTGNRNVELRAFHRNQVGGSSTPATASTE